MEAADMGDADAQYELGRNLRIEVGLFRHNPQRLFHFWQSFQLACE